MKFRHVNYSFARRPVEKGGFQKGFQSCLRGFSRGKLQAIDLSLGEVRTFRNSLQKSVSLQDKAGFICQHALLKMRLSRMSVHICSAYWMLILLIHL